MRTLTPVLCTSGLAAEARVARAAGFQVIVGAGDPRRTAALVEAAARRAKCLVSFGVAGGLAPHLRPGQVILSADVIGDERRWRSNQRFQEQVSGLARRIGALEGPVLGSSDILSTEEDKIAAWRDTGALAVDLESAIVARTAELAGLPFLVLRTVADPATRELPPAALIPLAVNGTPAVLSVIREVMRRPGQIAALFGLARETRQALTALAGPARALRAALAAT
jgi:adenosylhomocysteine nucleosidase